MRPAAGHAPPTPIPVPPLTVRGNQMFDSTGAPFLLRGVAMPGLEAISPGAADLAGVSAMNAFTFRVLQQRWNMNAVRLPVSAAVWRRDGPGYLDRVAAIVALANGEGLVAVLAARDDGSLPGAPMVDFWKACAARFARIPGVIFALYNEPTTRDIAGTSADTHRAADWQVWRNGGPLANGTMAVGMQDLVNAIRAGGAQQIVAAPGFQDRAGFQGFTADAYLADANAIYEWHPYYDVAPADAERAAGFGFLGGTFPLYAGAWGMPFGHATPACTAIPRDVLQAGDLLLQTLSYYDSRGVSWTASDFSPGSLIQDFSGLHAHFAGAVDLRQRQRPALGHGAIRPLVDDGRRGGLRLAGGESDCERGGRRAGPDSAR